MAGFFGLFNYSKPGKGVDTNAPPKRPILRYFELYWRKFSRMMLLNFLIFIVVLPIITLLFLQYDVFAQTLGMEIGQALNHLMLSKILIQFAGRFHDAVNWALLSVSALLYGPAMCGLTYMLRNTYREEHAWLSDFFVKMKENLVQGMILGILELGAIFFCTFNLLLQSDSTIMSIVKVVSFIGILFALMMRNYTYLMAVTFQLRTVNILTNALLFSFIGLFRNLGIILLEAALLIPLLLVSVYDIVFIPLFYMTVTGFAAMFVSYPLIHKFLIEPPENKDETDDKSDGDSDDMPTDTVERVDPRLLGGDIED